MESCLTSFSPSWGSLRFCVKSTVVYHYCRCCDSETDDSLLELLHVDDLVLCGESVQELVGKYKKWKETLEGKNLHINVGKTKRLQILDNKRRVTAKIDPCGVCRERVYFNSIKRLQCKKWVHCCYSDVSYRVIVTVVYVFVCWSCLGLNAAEIKPPVFKCSIDQRWGKFLWLCYWVDER